jgi:hypothetical protein
MGFGEGRRPSVVKRGRKREDERKKKRAEHSPTLVLVELVAHAFAKLFELAFLFGIVGLNEGDLQEPEAPREVFEALALLEVRGDLSAYLPGAREGIGIADLSERREGFVSLLAIQSQQVGYLRDGVIG